MVMLIILTEEQADHVRGPTSNGASLDPRRISAGDYEGSYALSVNVLNDPDHAMYHDYLAELPQADLNPLEAWPEDDIPPAP